MNKGIPENCTSHFRHENCVNDMIHKLQTRNDTFHIYDDLSNSKVYRIRVEFGEECGGYFEFGLVSRMSPVVQ